MFSKTIVALLALIPVLVDCACLNSYTYTYYFEGKNRKCANLRLDEARRQATCLVQEVRENCPATCGICCEDDPDYEFKLDNVGTLVPCSWISKNKKKRSTRRANYCPMGKFYAKMNIRNACTKSCKICQEFVPIDPTPSPSKAPTKSPSKAPTKSPTKAPTKSPTKAPTKSPTKSPTVSPVTASPTKTSPTSKSPTRRPSSTKQPLGRPLRLSPQFDYHM